MAKSKGEPCCGFSLCYSSVLGLRLCLTSSSACRCLFSSHASRISVRISPSVLPVTLEAARMLNRSRSCRISPLMYRFLLVFVFSQSSSSQSMATPMRFWVRPFPRLLNLYFPVGSVICSLSWCQLVFAGFEVVAEDVVLLILLDRCDVDVVEACCANQILGCCSVACCEVACHKMRLDRVPVGLKIVCSLFLFLYAKVINFPKVV